MRTVASTVEEDQGGAEKAWSKERDAPVTLPEFGSIFTTGRNALCWPSLAMSTLIRGM